MKAENQVKNNWEFSEVWIDAMLSPPYLLLLLGDREGNFRIYEILRLDERDGSIFIFAGEELQIKIIRNGTWRFIT